MIPITAAPDESRRRFLSTGAAALTALVGRRALHAVEAPAGAPVSPSVLGLQRPKPTPAQLAWQSCEVGVIFHFDLPIAAGDVTDNNGTRQRFDPALYQPEELDTDAWIEAARAAGARYALFTATHFNGFLQWRSDLYPYGVRQSTWRGGRGDVVADFVNSCRRAGILPGLYLSTHRNAYHTVWGHYVDWGRGRGTAAQAAFNRVAEGMVRELCTRFGPLVQLWFDAGVKTPAEGGPDVLPIVEAHQPSAAFYHSTVRSDHRWIGNEKGWAGYPCWSTMPRKEGVSHNDPIWKSCLPTGDPEGPVWSPGMVDVPLRNHNWFWHPGEERKLYSLERLVRMYDESVGRNCNLIFGAAIDRQGRLPAPDAALLRDFGAAIRKRYGRPVASRAGEGDSLELELPRPSLVEAVSLREDIAAGGERVRRYLLEGQPPRDEQTENDERTISDGRREREGGAWVPLAEGESIGHRRLQRFPAVRLSRLRWRALVSVDRPMLREFAVFSQL